MIIYFFYFKKHMLSQLAFFRFCSSDNWSAGSDMTIILYSSKLFDDQKKKKIS